MPTLTSLTVKLTGDAKGLVGATQTGVRALGRLAGGIGRATRLIGGLGVAVAGVGGGAMIALGRASAINIDRQAKLASNMNITTRQVQKLEFMAELSGIEIGTLSNAMQRLTRLQGDARLGNEKAAQGFARLGISMQDVMEADPITLFSKTILKLKELTSESLRASMGNALFEEQWRRLTPFIEGFVQNADRANAIFDGLDFGIGEGGAKEVEGLVDNLTVAQTMLTAFRDLVFVKLAPDINDTVAALGRMAEEFIHASGGANMLGEGIATKLLGTRDMFVEWAGDIKNAIQGIIAVGEFLMNVLRGVGTLGAGVFAAGEQALSGNFSGAGAVLSSLPQDLDRALGFTEQSADELREQTGILREILRSKGVVFQ